MLRVHRAPSVAGAYWLVLAATTTVMITGPALAQAPRAAQASLRVGVSTRGDADRTAVVTGRAIVPGPRVAVAQDTARRGVSGVEIAGHDADNVLPLVAFPVAQGVVGALIGGQE